MDGGCRNGAGPAGRNELGGPSWQLDGEVGFTMSQTALKDGKGLPAERVMLSRNAHSLDVSGIQPRSMLVVGMNATRPAAFW